jgi:MYXO-CTERM domain-containing protein
MRSIRLFFVLGATLTTTAANADSITDWGNNTYNQVSGIPSGADFIAISGGENHGLALASDGSIESWGWNGHNQVSGTPTDAGFTAIAAGEHYNFALTTQAAGPAVPEPAAILLALLGLAILPRRRRR